MKQNGRRILATALALTLALALCVPAMGAPDDGFATRGDVVKWLYDAYGNGAASDRLDAFSDVPADSGAAEAAAWAAGLGIAKGYGDGRFGPDDFVTREQAATMIYRLAQSMDQGFRGMWFFPLDYADAAEVSEWANEAMHWVVMNKIITEREAGLAPKDYIGVNELPVWMRNLEDALTVKLERDGYVLTIPVAIAGQLNTDLPADIHEGTLFTVSEQASIDAAEAKGYDGSSFGWLFAIEKVGEETARAIRCGDMSGVTLFAKDADGNHFVFRTPTDVRFERATTEEMMADSDVWASLNEWAASVKDSFINDNGLIPESFSNTLVDMYLCRAAYMEGANYTLSTTAYGPLEPAEGVDAAACLQRILEEVAFDYVDLAEGPDGEYAVLNFPEDGERFDFFTADGSLVRRVTESGYEEYYRASFEGEEFSLSDVVQEWYAALAAAHGKA